MKDRYSAYIVEDESIARYNLIKKLGEFTEIDIVGEASCISDAIIGITEFNPEILFLDIQLTDGTGFDLLNRIKYNGKVIFVTAYDEYAIRAFEINALDYLLKPISNTRLKSAIQKVIQAESQLIGSGNFKLQYDDRLLIPAGNCIHFLKISNIVAIHSSGDYTLVCDSEGHEFLVSKTMTEWENRLPNQYFCRINRQMIVNFQCIEKTKKLSSYSAQVYITGYDESFKISRSYFKRVRDRYR